MDRDVAATSLGGLAHDLSLWGLFVQADWVVKLVMVGLLLASVWVWAIIFEKIASIRRANRQADAFEHSFWSGGSLDELYRREGERPEHPIAAVFSAAMREWHQSADGLRGGGRRLSAAGTQERLDRAMNVTVQREMDRMERWMVFLASVGSVAPFVGLFGTVWG
ncbi:MAG: MotA/TolQ/ExbB proton channel family protein, partial [Gemmatimonadetes bacterium]|nr:MotA/TolQ/ExbB proton channel family protein [Gemmatimonadota bacterium]